VNNGVLLETENVSRENNLQDIIADSRRLEDLQKTVMILRK